MVITPCFFFYRGVDEVLLQLTGRSCLGNNDLCIRQNMNCKPLFSIQLQTKSPQIYIYIWCITRLHFNPFSAIKTQPKKKKWAAPLPPKRTPKSQDRPCRRPRYSWPRIRPCGTWRKFTWNSNGWNPWTRGCPPCDARYSYGAGAPVLPVGAWDGDELGRCSGDFLWIVMNSVGRCLGIFMLYTDYTVSMIIEELLDELMEFQWTVFRFPWSSKGDVCVCGEWC